MGMGHLSPHAPLLRALFERGHEITIVSRDVSRAAVAFAGLGCRIFQAPVDLKKPQPLYVPTVTFAQVLHNSGWWHEEALAARVASWQALLDCLQPDLVLSDFAPTLTLALRGRNLPHAALGTGFFVPPNTSALPRYWSFKDQLPAGVPQDEHATLRLVNAALKRCALPGAKHFAALFHEGVLPLLKTVPELDHYPEREGGRYLGPPPSPRGGPEVKWPAGPGARVFGYLKPFPGIETALGQLRELGLPTVIVADGLRPEVMRKFESARLRFMQERACLWQVSEQCDVALCNANHGTTAHFLLSGKPVLSFPLYLEQQLIAGAVNKIGAGLAVNPQTARATGQSLKRLLEDSSFQQAAVRFSERNQGYPMDSYLERALGALSELAPI